MVSLMRSLGSAAPGVSFLLIAVMSGCDPLTAPLPDEAEQRPALAAKFDPATVGWVTGRVHWCGALPGSPPINAPIAMPEGNTAYRQFPNPNAPRIDPQAHVLEGAVIFLEGIDPERARPWDHDRVRI